MAHGRVRSASALLLVLPALVGAQPTPVGPEFQVNSYTTEAQYVGGAAIDGAGDFVLVWASFSSGHAGAFGQRYDASGTPLGSEFQVNSYTTSWPTYPAVAGDATGNFLVVWDIYGEDGDAHGVFGQRYDAGGAPQGPEFWVNSHTTSSQNGAAVAADGAGNYVVVWHSFLQDGDSSGVYGQRYDASGTPLGGEFAVNTYTTNAQFDPAVAADAAGNFVVLWSSYGQDGYWGGVFGRRFNAAGIPLGVEFQVNEYTTFSQDSPAVAADAAGAFMVVWGSITQDGSSTSVQGRRYDAAGVPQSPEFQVNTFTSSSQGHPAVAADAAGDFIVVWDSSGRDGSGFGIAGQRYDAGGAPQGPEFQVNTYTTGNQLSPVVAVGAGAAVVAWDSAGQPTGCPTCLGGGTSTTSTIPAPTSDVFAQRFSMAPPLSTSTSSSSSTSTSSTSTSSTTSTTAPASLVLTRVRIRATSPPGAGNGAILVKGEFSASPPLTSPPAIGVTVEDGGGLSQTHTFGACTPSGGGLRCRESSPAGVLAGVFRLRAGSIYRARIRWSRLNGVDPPFLPPVTVTIAQSGGVDRVGSIATCEASALGLRCRTP